MPTITSPNDDALDTLCQRLSESAAALDTSEQWPAEQLQLCADGGVYEWFVPEALGGQGWSDADVVRGYLKLSAACLTTTFIITQLTGACRRIAASDNVELKTTLLPDLIAGRTFSTLGISHLTTSHRHLARPVLRAEETDAGITLDGFSPWVTGGLHADTIVIGASLDDGSQVIVVLPTNLPGVRAGEAVKLIGLTASKTGPVHCDRVEIERRWILAGPDKNVISGSKGSNTGGLQTSTLAVGLSAAAIGLIEHEGQRRPELLAAAAGLKADYDQLEGELLARADGQPSCTTEQLRTRANSLVLRSTQAAMAAAKGAGYVVGHPAGRWCREALFFLVWSCPQSVMAANLCELAGIEDSP